MKAIVHKANTRGHIDHGWLASYHTFSFAGYSNPERMNFGMLRVLNDDTVQGGKGFGSHPHDNMEIVSIPLSGSLEHKDSTGAKTVIRTNDVQIMSAGTGVVHSEFNHSRDEGVNFLQLWIFPKKRNIAPRYDQKTFRPEERNNKIVTVVSPEDSDETLWINQRAYISLATLGKGFSTDYQLKGANYGVYAFIIEGNAIIGNENLEKRDGAGFWETDRLNIRSRADTKLLLIEVAMSSRGG